MQTLMILDRKDYTQDMPVFEKYAVRAVIVRDGRVAMQKGKSGYYKLLGGGMEAGEDECGALMREVREESGLLVKKETIREIGEIIELREDLFQKGTKYVCHSRFYFCDAEEGTVEPSLTESERAEEFRLVWAEPDEILEGNRNFLQEPWIDRDTRFIRLLKENKLP